MKIQKITNNYIIMILLLGIFYGSSATAKFGPDRQAGISEEEQRKLSIAKEKFEKSFKLLSQPARDVIIEGCGNWDDMENAQEWRNWLKQCEQRVAHSRQLEHLKADFRTHQQWTQVFPEEDNPDIPKFLQGVSNHIEKDKLITSHYQFSFSKRIDGDYYRATGDTSLSESNVLRRSEAIAFMERYSEDSFLEDRKEFLMHYGCNEEVGRSPIMNCYNNQVARQFPQDKKCIENHGFKNCRPFLIKSGCNKDAVLALASELSKEDKTGMTYICWKAATQGAQCCMNPDQCPTDGAFRSIASQLQKAAPGLVQSFAGLEAIKGDYQKACEMSLMANAAGPLAQLQTKTCGDSVNACEETCDKKVQEFKENFKQAVMGRQRQSLSPRRRGADEKPLTIDEIVNAAKLIEKDNPQSDVSDTETATEDIKTCSQAVVYLDNLFKDRKESKKIKSLSEKLSHASLVDCSGEVFKHSSGGGSSGGGANPMGGLGGMNPMAAQMCRQGNPNGPGPPRFPVVGPTPNPRMGQNYFTGGKTVAPGGDFVAPGTPGAPPEEFIEPPRGPAGTNALQGGWTDTGGSGSSPGGGGPGGGGLTGSPSRDEEGGNGGTGDNLPMAYPEGFDSGSGGLDSGGGDLSTEDAERLRMAEYMKERDKAEERKRGGEIERDRRPGEHIQSYEPDHPFPGVKKRTALRND